MTDHPTDHLHDRPDESGPERRPPARRRGAPVRRAGALLGLAGALALGAGPASISTATGSHDRTDGPLAPGSVTKVGLDLPGSPSAVLANIAMVDGATPGYITADLCSAIAPGPQSRSNGNHGAGVASSNLTVVRVDDERFCIYNQAEVNLVVDAQGYFAARDDGHHASQYGGGDDHDDGLLFNPVAPQRRLDTRVAPSTKPAPGSVIRVATGAPAGARAVLANVTMFEALGAGYITAGRCTDLHAVPQSKATANHPAGTAVANLAVVPIDKDGAFCIYNQQSVNMTVDVQGWFGKAVGFGFAAAAPTRILDTRVAPAVSPVAGSITRVETGAVAGTEAVLVNLAMVDGAGAGYVTADRCSALVPGPQAFATASYSGPGAVSNLAVVPVDPDGAFCVYAHAAVNVIADLQGSFGSAGDQAYFPYGPKRVLDTRR